LGLKLAQRLIDEARLIGYDYMRLDTVPKPMADANRLYRSLGFYEIAAYYNNPQPEVSYLDCGCGESGRFGTEAYATGYDQPFAPGVERDYRTLD
jgi:ribosomal protein S18 acetylase RimI-like enzyme